MSTLQPHRLAIALLMLLAGCAEMPLATGVNHFSVQTLLITHPVIIPAGESWRCVGGSIDLSGEGHWQIEAGGRLDLENATITIHQDKEETPEEIVHAYLARILPGSRLILRDSSVIVHSPLPIAEVDKSSGLPKRWLIARRKREAGQITHLTIEHNHFAARDPYTVGLVYLGDEKPLNLLQGTDQSTVTAEKGYTTGSFNDNRIEGFTGGFAGIFLRNFTIADNHFMGNYGGSIAVSGRGITVRDNEIRYPGNGGNGDGISIYRYLEDAVIENNIITDGSCYGIWALTSEMHHVTIRHNYIAHGITTGLYFSMPPGEDIEGDFSDIHVYGNQLVENKGVGIAANKGMRNLQIQRNWLTRNNAPDNWQALVARDVTIGMGENYYGEAPTTNPLPDEVIGFFQ